MEVIDRAQVHTEAGEMMEIVDRVHVPAKKEGIIMRELQITRAHSRTILHRSRAMKCPGVQFAMNRSRYQVVGQLSRIVSIFIATDAGDIMFRWKKLRQQIQRPSICDVHFVDAKLRANSKYSVEKNCAVSALFGGANFIGRNTIHPYRKFRLQCSVGEGHDYNKSHCIVRDLFITNLIELTNESDLSLLIGFFFLIQTLGIPAISGELDRST